MAAQLKSWELDNSITLTDPHRDALYTYSTQSQKTQQEAKPWKSDPHHFTSVRISAVALLKMVMHARSGGAYEIMGLMQGYIHNRSIIVTDAFRLPVEGTETRVNAQDEANEYMVNFLSSARDAGQMENAVGWYHSHPGYGCWLSGIDVNTQMTQQTFSDPFVAVVIDPDRTISAGKVEIGAFRTFPEGYKAGGGASSKGGGGGGGGESQETVDGMVGASGEEQVDAEGFQSIPLAKMEDFGAYSDRYYSLEVSHFKSSLDTKLLEALWNKYWVSTLAASPLFTNRQFGTRQIEEMALKVKRHAEGMSLRNAGAGGGQMRSGAATTKNDEQLQKIVQAGRKIAMEEENGLMAGEVKEQLFAGMGRPQPPNAAIASTGAMD